ncbi:MAG: LytTR family DNA-binding domain-containing protein [Ferruginibacter sp.]
MTREWFKFDLNSILMEQAYTCMIVDDDTIDRLTTVSFVRKYSFLNVAGVFASAEEALEAAVTATPQVVLLDIDMPGLSGLELRRQLAAVPACIFITSYPDYAVESFELEALDFLVKPLKADRFDKAMQRLQEYMNLRHKAELFDYTLGADTILIKDGHEHVKLKLQDIVYLEALKDYTGIVTSQKKYCVLSSLGKLLKENTFKTFIRIHRSYAVQKHFIERITAQEVFVKNLSLPVGRSYKDALAELKS